MKRNMGSVDRIVRLVVGVLLLGLYGALEPPLRYVTLIGLVFVGTALSGVCPLYNVFGIRTTRAGTSE